MKTNNMKKKEVVEMRLRNILNGQEPVDDETYQNLHLFIDSEDSDMSLEFISMCILEAGYFEDYIFYRSSDFVCNHFPEFKSLILGLQFLK